MTISVPSRLKKTFGRYIKCKRCILSTDAGIDKTKEDWRRQTMRQIDPPNRRSDKNRQSRRRIDSDSYTTSKLTEVERTSDTVRSQLRPKSTGPWKFISVTTDTVTIDERGIQNTIYIDRATLAPWCITPSAVNGKNRDKMKTLYTEAVRGETIMTGR